MIKLGLTGWPVSHSLSPVMHNSALKVAGIAGEYRLYPVDPANPGALPALIDLLRGGDLHGLNVTIPHKQSVIHLMDDLTASAREIGAVNMIYMQDDRLIGHNTDAPGFIADLRRQFFVTDEEWSLAKAGCALVLGAGGSARAVVWALVNAGWRVIVASRRVEQAAGLVESFNGTASDVRLSGISLMAGEVEKWKDDVNLIINTTSAGMTPNINTSPWPASLSFPAKARLYDLVYNPAETLLMRQVRAAGLQAVSGLGMLIEQAALSFEIWTGRPAPREIMTLAVEA